MNKLKRHILPVAALLLMAVGCTPEPALKVTDGQLTGKWLRTADHESYTYYYRFDADHGGATWSADPAEDVSEAEGKPLTWQLVDDARLEVTIHGEGVVALAYENYNISRIASDNFACADDWKRTDTFKRVTP